MFVKGTREEIEWLFMALADGCTGCPYREKCNALAVRDAVKHNGRVTVSCKSFLKECIEYEFLNEKHNI